MVDQNGNIFEGHLNEDYETLDVKGTHASGANLGSMGVALLGTFSFSPDGPNRIFISDLTTTDDDLGLWMDDLRWKSAPPSITAVSPNTGNWLNNRETTFE